MPGVEGFIGRGALGEVRKGSYRGVVVALKTLHLLWTDPESIAAMGVALAPVERQAVLAALVKECEMLRRCTHANIVPFIGLVIDQEPLYLALQYIPSGTLHDLIHGECYAAMRTDAGTLPLQTQLLANCGLFSALAFLATVPMIHRDVKPANILVRVHDETLEKVLLADFGEAKQLTRTMTVRTMAGTPIYMAPEMREEDDAKGPKADVFSGGVVMVEMSTGTGPNPGPEMRKEGRRRVGVPEEERRAADLAAVRHPVIAELARRCIVDDDGERADAAEIVERLAAATVGGAANEGAAITVLVRHVSRGRNFTVEAFPVRHPELKLNRPPCCFV